MAARLDGFAGKRALVTGAASGIGLALAHELAERGAHLALVDIDPAVHTLAEQLDTAQRRASGHLADVAERPRMHALVDEVVARHGGIDLLINNAGVSVAARFDEMPDADLDWLFGINFFGAVNGCRAFLPVLRAQPQAHIVNVCSSFAWLGIAGKSAYSASKAALRAFSESLRMELAEHGIGVTLLFPGPVDTAIVRRGRVAHEAQRAAEAAFLAGRAVDARKVARRCLAGVLADRARVVVSLDYHALDLAVRLSPSLAHAAVAAVTRKLDGFQ